MLQTLLQSLNIDPLVLLMNGALFLVTLGILNFVFWKPMMRHLDRRKEDISNAYRTVEEARHELDALRQEYQGRLARIESEARGRIQQTVREAQVERDRMIAEARARAEETMRQGAAAIEQEKQQATIAMHPTLDDIALQALTRATGAPSSAQQRELVDEYIAQNVVAPKS